MFRKAFLCVLCVLCGGEFAAAATSELADAVMNRDARAVRALMQRQADVNTPQIDGTTALALGGAVRRSGHGGPAHPRRRKRVVDESRRRDAVAARRDQRQRGDAREAASRLAPIRTRR